MHLFTCQVHNTPLNLEWQIHFETPDLSNMIQSYVAAADHPGDVHEDHRNDYTFTFNLTFVDNNASILMSTLTITSDAKLNTSNTLHQATINCTQEHNEDIAIFLINTGKHLSN